MVCMFSLEVCLKNKACTLENLTLGALSKQRGMPSSGKTNPCRYDSYHITSAIFKSKTVYE